MQHNTVINVVTESAALAQLNTWKRKAALEQQKGVIPVNTICGLNRAYMVYRTIIINKNKAT